MTQSSAVPGAHHRTLDSRVGVALRRRDARFLGGAELTTAGGGLRALRWVGPNGAGLVRVSYDPASGSETMAVRGPRMTDIDRVKASSVVALEVYPSPNAAPPEFQVPGAECGTVLIWTWGREYDESAGNRGHAQRAVVAR